MSTSHAGLNVEDPETSAALPRVKDIAVRRTIIILLKSKEGTLGLRRLTDMPVFERNSSWKTFDAGAARSSFPSKSKKAGALAAGKPGCFFAIRWKGGRKEDIRTATQTGWVGTPSG